METQLTTLLWHSNSPTILTGYGQQTSLMVPKIRDLGYDMSLNCPMGMCGSPLAWNGMELFPNTGDNMGNDNLPHRSALYDYTITLCDLFALFPCASQLSGRKIAHWMPVDCDPMGEKDIATLRATQGFPIALSRFGRKMLDQEGFDGSYVPHGVDTTVFKPGNRQKSREMMNIRDETFLVGIAAVNKPDERKGWAEQMAAFAAFHQSHPDSVLFCHTNEHGGWELNKIALNLGISNAVMFPDQYTLAAQIITTPMMSNWYNALDVLMECSYGEGFGLPVLEAQACGTPVITADSSAMTELCTSGWLVEGQRHWVGGHESWWRVPSVNAMTARLEEAFNAREDQAVRDQARNFALDYDADLVASNYWKPALIAMQEYFNDR